MENKPSLKLIDAILIVAGSMIGSGIFIVSADMSRTVSGYRLDASIMGTFRINYSAWRIKLW
jgi:hypothetical protein